MWNDFSRILAASILCPLAIAASGCGTNEVQPGAVNVTGTIYLDGKPLDDAEIRFIGQNFTTSSKTDSEGRYLLVQGALPGEYVIAISKWKAGKFGIDSAAGMDEGQFLAMQDPALMGVSRKSNPGPEQLIPDRFSNPIKSEIVFKVPEEGTESADFRITAR